MSVFVGDTAACCLLPGTFLAMLASYHNIKDIRKMMTFREMWLLKRVDCHGSGWKVGDTLILLNEAFSFVQF